MLPIGEEIRRLAVERGYATQQAFADAAGLSQSFVALIYTGKRPNLTADVLFAICRALNVGSDHFEPWFPPATSDRPVGKRK